MLASPGLPRFYDKLLPAPILNLVVRGVDRVSRSATFARLNPARLVDSVAPLVRYTGYTAIPGISVRVGPCFRAAATS